MHGTVTERPASALASLQRGTRIWRWSAASAAPPMSGEARRRISEADRKLASHRAALEAGADPAVVTAGIREVAHDLGDMVSVLSSAEPALKSRIYANLGLRLTYHSDQKKVLVAQA